LCPHPGEGKIVETWVFEVDHPAAAETDQVMMSARLNLETRRRARMTHLASYADLNQRV
jgi:hypothetical protein